MLLLMLPCALPQALLQWLPQTLAQIISHAAHNLAKDINEKPDAVHPHSGQTPDSPPVSRADTRPVPQSQKTSDRGRKASSAALVTDPSCKTDLRTSWKIAITHGNPRSGRSSLRQSKWSSKTSATISGSKWFRPLLHKHLHHSSSSLGSPTGKTPPKRKGRYLLFISCDSKLQVPCLSCEIRRHSKGTGREMDQHIFDFHHECTILKYFLFHTQNSFITGVKLHSCVYPNKQKWSLLVSRIFTSLITFCSVLLCIPYYQHNFWMSSLDSSRKKGPLREGCLIFYVCIKTTHSKHLHYDDDNSEYLSCRYNLQPGNKTGICHHLLLYFISHCQTICFELTGPSSGPRHPLQTTFWLNLYFNIIKTLKRVK